MNSRSFYSRTKWVALILAVFVLGEFFWSMLFPSYDPSHPYWIPLKELNFYKTYSFDVFDSKLINTFLPFIANYHVNVDVGGYMLLAHDFPNHYFRGHITFLTRPLYSAIVSLLALPLRLISNSYSMTFLSGIALNLVLFWITLFLFYLLIRDTISPRTGFLSSLLLAFSPFAHTWLTQPETNIFGAFAIILSLYLLSRYVEKPSLEKLLCFSLVLGILLLGKKLFAISFFVLFLSLYFKRYKEGIVFLAVHLIPFLAWYLWVTFVWKLDFYVDEISSFGVGVWLFSIFHVPWYETVKKIIDAVPNFINATLYGFILLPVIFSLIGFCRIPFKKKYLFGGGYILSFFLLFFIQNFYIARHAFLLFPVIYPLAVMGIERAAKFFALHAPFSPLLWTLLSYGAILGLSNINVYYLVSYG